MTDIYLIDRASRLEAILEELSTPGSDEALEAPLGIGFFTCRRARISEDGSPSEKGTIFDASPAFLRRPLLSEILAGRQSPLSQELLLYGTPGPEAQTEKDRPVHPGTLPHTRGSPLKPAGSRDLEHLPLLHRWLILGLHPLRDLAAEQVPLSPMNENLLRSASSLQSATRFILDAVLSKAADLGARTLVVPLDSALLMEFLFELLGPKAFGLETEPQVALRFQNLTRMDWEHCQESMAAEVISIAAQYWGDNRHRFIFLCDSTTRLERLIGTARGVKNTLGPDQNLFLRV